MIPTFTAAVAGITALAIIAALLWRVRQLTKTLEDAKAVTRVLSGNWKGIPTYVSRTGEILCSAFNCPSQGHIEWPSQRPTLYQIINGFVTHHRQYHTGSDR